MDDYEKAMKDVWEAKEAIYDKFNACGEINFIDFLYKELKYISITYREKV